MQPDLVDPLICLHAASWADVPHHVLIRIFPYNFSSVPNDHWHVVMQPFMRRIRIRQWQCQASIGLAAEPHRVHCRSHTLSAGHTQKIASVCSLRLPGVGQVASDGSHLAGTCLKVHRKARLCKTLLSQLLASASREPGVRGTCV